MARLSCDISWGLAVSRPGFSLVKEYVAEGFLDLRGALDNDILIVREKRLEKVYFGNCLGRLSSRDRLPFCALPWSSPEKRDALNARCE